MDADTAMRLSEIEAAYRLMIQEDLALILGAGIRWMPDVIRVQDRKIAELTAEVERLRIAAGEA